MLRLYGTNGSPYTVKVRSYLRYKRVPFMFKQGFPTGQNWPEHLQAVRPRVIPVIELPNGDVLVDSTPTIERLEELFPNRPVLPRDPCDAFLAHLIEDFADEWVRSSCVQPNSLAAL